MNNQESNPMYDHLLARIIFNLAKEIPGGSVLTIVASEIYDEVFCAEQLLLIAENEGKQKKKTLDVYTSKDIFYGQAIGAKLIMDCFKKKMNKNIQGPNVIVAILKQPATHQLLYNSTYAMRVQLDGMIHVDKMRYGILPGSIVPWEELQGIFYGQP